MNNSVKHVSSHASLLRDVSTASTSPSGSRLDAIVVPASRPSLQRLISLSADLSVPLVVLCSRQAQVEKVAERVEATFGARALVIDVPHDYQLLDHHHFTSDRAFWKASAERASDLSIKRNLGLVLARLRGWSKILFVDDDISQLRPRDVARLSGYLDRHPVAAMASKQFPDNSVVCHARRLAGLGQDVFVSGAVLGVNTQHSAVSFFPDVYNEDWFFFAQHAAARSLPKVGEVRQDEYDPYFDPQRAAREELGDLLAEGLYALFNGTPGWDLSEQLRAATSSRHWRLFIEDRRQMISETDNRLSAVPYTSESGTSAVCKAQKSLGKAAEQLDIITPELCVDFIERWREDDVRWQQVMPRRGTALSEREAMNELQVEKWVSCGYGTDPGSSKSRTAAFDSSLIRSSDRPKVLSS
ncbi:hypothetical protein Kfla_0644 [Kribbella flavida DSM 17836]|uniref:Uncharacterized protein n=1 Tax=Kribbella flavida (strain DSM 17836 / JCM 10339 / NBRC 14399) TaxID=479435 RepID=D2PXB7_KRIFD|nr:hypothetical protein [Kribbella flavida]ADB29765.1 hypothetical protein Kfla_0644 [Kribbella flavida DSM 17836]